MPDTPFPTWVQDALASGTVKASELIGWTPLGRYLFHHVLGNSAQVRIEHAADKTNLAWVGGYNKDADVWQFAILRPFPEALRIANNLIAALEGSQPSEVERLQKRVGELTGLLRELYEASNHYWFIDPSTREENDARNVLCDKVRRALSPIATGYIGDGAPIQKTDALGVVEDETL